MALLPYPGFLYRTEAPASGGSTEPPVTPIPMMRGLLVAVTDQSVLKVDQMAGTNGLELLAGAWIPSTDDSRNAGIYFADGLGNRFRLKISTIDTAYQQVRINGEPTYTKTKDLLHKRRERFDAAEASGERGDERDNRPV